MSSHHRGRRSYSYSCACKRAFSTPTVAHHFELEWPWPVTSSSPQIPAATASSNNNTPKNNNTTTSNNGPGGPSSISPRKREGATKDGVCAADLDVLPRRYEHETHILSLSADPSTPSSSFSTDDVQRVCAVLSPGYRFYIPLQTLPAPVQLPTGGHLYWRTAFKPVEGVVADVVPPMCSEIVVGELSAIEWVARQWKETLSLRRPPCASFMTKVNLSAASGSQVVSDATITDGCRAPPHWVSSVPASQLPVVSSLFHSVPAKVLWLPDVEDCLVASLPCEERIVTLRVPRHPQGYSPGRREPVQLPPTHSLQCTRGMVPLDIAAIYQRPFIAVGTYEHGVLICKYCRATGAVEQIVRRISMSGQGSSIYPITRVAAVFPPLSSRRKGDGCSAQRCFPWQEAAAELLSLADGVLVCSSPFDPQSLVVKQLHTPDAVVESFPPAREMESIIHVSPHMSDDVGTLVITSPGRLMMLHVLDESHNHSSATPAVDDSEEDGEDPDNMPLAESTAGDLGLLLHSCYNGGLQTIHGAAAERVAPIVTFKRVQPASTPLLRTNDSTVIYQEKPVCHNRLHGPSIRHFLLGISRKNEVVLLDRSVMRMYQLTSVLPLHPEMNARPLRVATDLSLSKSAAKQPAGAPAKRRGRPPKRPLSSPTEDAMKVPKPEPVPEPEPEPEPEPVPEPSMPAEDGQAAAEPEYLVDYASGAVFLSAGHEWLSVAVAHHRNRFTVLVYHGTQSGTKIFRAGK